MSTGAERRRKTFRVYQQVQLFVNCGIGAHCNAFAFAVDQAAKTATGRLSFVRQFVCVRENRGAFKDLKSQLSVNEMFSVELAFGDVLVVKLVDIRHR